MVWCWRRAQKPITWLALGLIHSSGEIRVFAEQYIAIRLWGAPAALLNVAILGWLLGVRAMRSALFTQCFLNGVNILLSIVLVVHLGFGIEGLAWATVISEIIGASLCVVLALTEQARLGGRWDFAKITNRKALKRMFAVNSDILVRSLLLQLVLVLFVTFGAHMGEASLAANAILLQFQSFMAYALDGISTAAEVMAGSARGGRNRDKLRRSFHAVAISGGALSIAFALGYFCLGRTIVGLMTDIQEVRDEAYAFLPWSYILPMVFSLVILIGWHLYRSFSDKSNAQRHGYVIPDFSLLQLQPDNGYWESRAMGRFHSIYDRAWNHPWISISLFATIH